MSEAQESEELLSDTQEEPTDGSPEPSDAVSLSHETPSSPNKAGTSWRLSLQKRIRNSSLFHEILENIKLTVPIFLMYFFQQLLFFFTLLLVGHSTSHSKTKLDAAALANSVVNVTGFSIVIGLASAADTLCPQAFGFKNYRKVGIILQRGVFILSLVCLPIAALWLNTESILLLLHQPPCVARLTAQFVQIFILAILPMIVYVMMMKYLQAQSLVWVFVIVGILQNIVNLVLASLLIYVADMVIIGSALSLVMSYIFTPFFLIAYVWGRGLHKQTWKGWSWDSLTEWSLFFKLGVPGLLMICFEWWTYEISTIVAGSINELQLAVNTILMQFGMIMYSFPLGIGTAAGVRVGNELGAGHPQKAKYASYAALIVQGAVALVILVFFASTRTFIAGVFTSEQDVIDETAKAMIPGAAVFFLDQFQGTFAGIIRGSGRQKIGAIMNFVFYYMIGLPVGISLALLTDLGTTGMWTGLLVAVVITAMKNAADHKENVISGGEGESERDDETSDSASESSVVSVETCTEDLDVELPHTLNGAVLLNEDEEERGQEMSNGKVNIEDIPLISFKDAENFEVSKPHPHLPRTKEHKKLQRKKLRLILSKGSFFAIGLLAVLVGCVLLLSFKHDDVTEMCLIDDGEANATNSSSSSTLVLPSNLVPPTTSMPRPTTTVSNLFEMTTIFIHQ